MSLWESAMQPCTLFELKRVSDGEGGFASVYAPSAPFEAAIKLDSSTEARIAAKEGAEDRYTVTTKAPLKAAEGSELRVLPPQRGGLGGAE